MEQFGHNLVSAAQLAGNQDGRGAPPRVFFSCVMSRLTFGLSPTRRASKSAGFDRRGRHRGFALGHRLLKLHAAAERAHEFIDLERLLQVIERTRLERLNRALRARVGGHDDDHRTRVVELQLLEQRDAVHRLHVDVSEDEVEFVGLVTDQRLLAIGRERGLVTGRVDDSLQHLVNRDQIIDDEDGWHGG